MSALGAKSRQNTTKNTLECHFLALKSQNFPPTAGTREPGLWGSFFRGSFFSADPVRPIRPRALTYESIAVALMMTIHLIILELGTIKQHPNTASVTTHQILQSVLVQGWFPRIWVINESLSRYAEFRSVFSWYYPFVPTVLVFPE